MLSLLGPSPVDCTDRTANHSTNGAVNPFSRSQCTCIFISQPDSLFKISSRSDVSLASFESLLQFLGSFCRMDQLPYC